ncbi:DUF1549 and DUF1553 domain-containing protein [Blastopirellula marina]|uniref:DUF1549 domain-containing protein n=1 Tax=Blastopirellula marina TaxID=124 RepID=A0A2S8FLK3_9BACT|nr:DUF1549 and DUF1553 domain-containing protein [Blastopirellula marina]PQO33072.1 hypothetical protein C5Y98_18225 [Blastopirellula marina]PTL43239.1 DUF1549 domain-containing protein [Blastopirellula marina]
MSRWQFSPVTFAPLALGLVLVLTAGAFAADRSEDYGIPQVATINEKIRLGWQDYGISPSPEEIDTVWARRLFLDVLGRVPSVDELNDFARDRSRDKKKNLVDRLLFDEKYTEEYARNWTTVWTNVLIGRNGGTANNSQISRAGMQKYLRDTFARNTHYDKMVEELVSATGANTPGMPGFNGAVNFYMDKLDEDGVQATAKTAQIFLGLQVQCTQCHNHPFNEWKQEKFWNMNAFFRQTRAMRGQMPGNANNNGMRAMTLNNVDFMGEGRNIDNAEIYYELRNGLLKVAYPEFLDGQKIPANGRVAQVNRREELAKFIVESENLQEAIVNRYWGHFLGYGFTKPVDDMGPHNRPTHPELLTYLGQELRENSFDLKQLIRWIALSEAYSLSSKITKGNSLDDPTVGEPPKFSHFYLRQMQAEQLYESLLVATQAHKTRGNYEEQEKKKSEWMQQFVTAFGTDEGDEATTFNGTIPQALMMFNGDLVMDAVSTKPGSFIYSMAAEGQDGKEAINHLYMATVARRPTRKELEAANYLIGIHKGDTAKALQDVFWALLNSNEFILNH